VAAKTPETRSKPTFPESSFKYNPLIHVRVLFVRFIQGLFAAAPEGSYRWQPDDENTEIYITDEGVVKPEVVEKMPAVTITRGPVQFYNLGLDDLEQYDFALDRKTKGVLLPGTLTINACARVDLESEHIAFVIADHIWLLRDLLMKSGFFETGRGIQVGSPSPAGSIIANDRGDEFFCTPVSVPFQFARLSSFTPLGRNIVSSIQQAFRVRGITRQFGLGSPRNDPSIDHEIPLSLHLCPPPPFAPNAQDLQRSDLPLQPHPLNPAVQVRVRVVRPNRTGLKLVPRGGAVLPITQPCVEQSGQSAPAFEQKG
jgi:hypothetical protein